MTLNELKSNMILAEFNMEHFARKLLEQEGVDNDYIASIHREYSIPERVDVIREWIISIYGNVSNRIISPIIKKAYSYYFEKELDMDVIGK